MDKNTRTVLRNRYSLSVFQLKRVEKLTHKLRPECLPGEDVYDISAAYLVASTKAVNVAKDDRHNWNLKEARKHISWLKKINRY